MNYRIKGKEFSNCISLFGELFLQEAEDSISVSKSIWFYCVPLSGGWQWTEELHFKILLLNTTRQEIHCLSSVWSSSSCISDGGRKSNLIGHHRIVNCVILSNNLWHPLCQNEPRKTGKRLRRKEVEQFFNSSFYSMIFFLPLLPVLSLSLSGGKGVDGGWLVGCRFKFDNENHGKCTTLADGVSCLLGHTQYWIEFKREHHVSLLNQISKRTAIHRNRIEGVEHGSRGPMSF